MALFEFNLKPLQDVLAWGEEPNQYLHWFGLTDAIYYMNVGKEQLFRYSDEILEFWTKEYPDEAEAYQNPFYDYQVSRLYFDILEILPNVLQPIPKPINDYISSLEKQNKWEATLSEINDISESEQTFNNYCTASEWLFDRKLKGLGGGPDILLWRVEGRVFLRWDNSSYKQNNIHTWATISGEVEFSVKDFLAEIQSFHDRLMKSMEERIKVIGSTNPLPHIKFNMPELLKEQEEIKKSFEEVLTKAPSINDWNDITKANHYLFTKINTEFSVQHLTK